AGRIAPGGHCPLGQQRTKEPVRGPRNGGDGRDTEPLVDGGSFVVVDTCHHARHVEVLPGNAGGDDVRVVATGHRGERIRLADRSLVEYLAVETDADDLSAAELAAESAKSLAVPVDDRDIMAEPLQRGRERGADTPTPHDDHVQRSASSCCW